MFFISIIIRQNFIFLAIFIRGMHCEFNRFLLHKFFFLKIYFFNFIKILYCNNLIFFCIRIKFSSWLIYIDNTYLTRNSLSRNANTTNRFSDLIVLFAIVVYLVIFFIVTAHIQHCCHNIALQFQFYVAFSLHQILCKCLVFL